MFKERCHGLPTECDDLFAFEFSYLFVAPAGHASCGTLPIFHASARPFTSAKSASVAFFTHWYGVNHRVKLALIMPVLSSLGPTVRLSGTRGSAKGEFHDHSGWWI